MALKHDKTQPPAREYEWLLVGGAPRSGTTLLYHLLKAHSAIALKNERDLFERLLAAGQGQVAREYLAVLNDDQIAGLRYLGEKRPEYYEYDLQRHFSSRWPKIVHLSRRPADVIGSMLKRAELARQGRDPGWSPHFGVRDAVDIWLRAWRYAMSNRDQPWFLHIKYEDLIDAPARVLGQVVSHLEISDISIPPDMIFTPKSHVLEGEAQRLLSTRLARIDNDWHRPLPELERDYQSLAPPLLSGMRRLRRRLLWHWSVRQQRR